MKLDKNTETLILTILGW